MFSSTEIGRPFGIRLSLHGTFWLLPAFVLFSGLLSAGLSYALFEVAVLLAVFACVALHEIGHAMAARRYGIGTQSIELYPLGGVAKLDRMPRSPMQEVVIALAGPAVNVGIALALIPLFLLDGYSFSPVGQVSGAVELFWSRLLWANIGLVLFNLLPAFPMDGGRVLRAVASTVTDRLTATEFAAGLGTLFAIGFGLLGVVTGHLMLIVLAVFLYLTGRSELASVRKEEWYRRAREQFNPFGWFSRPMPVTVQADGWVYNPQARVWTLYENGRAVRHERSN
jgi:Zn-dependent protease